MIKNPPPSDEYGGGDRITVIVGEDGNLSLKGGGFGDRTEDQKLRKLLNNGQINTGNSGLNTPEKIAAVLTEKVSGMAGDMKFMVQRTTEEMLQEAARPESMSAQPFFEVGAYETPFDEVSIANITDYNSWLAVDADIKANPKNLSPEFEQAFNDRGDNLKDLAASDKVEELFSIEVLTSDDMTASKLQMRIELASAKGLKVPAEINNTILPLLEGRQTYTSEDLIKMSVEERALVAKYATDAATKSLAAEMNQNDSRAFAWISEVGNDAAKAETKARQFLAAGDLKNFNLASNIKSSIDAGQKPYEDLIKPSNITGKSSEELESILRVATGYGATEQDLASLNDEIRAVRAIEGNSLFRKYADNATSLAKTQQQIVLAQTELGANDGGPNDTKGAEVIAQLQAIAELQRKDEIQKAAIEKGIIGQVLDAVITGPENTKSFGIVLSKPGVEGYFDPDTGEEIEARLMSESELDSFKTIRTETQKLVTELGEANTALGEGMNTAAQAISIVENDVRVTGAGGKLAKLISKAARGTGQVFSVVEELFKSNEQITLEMLKRNGGFNNNFLEAVVSGNVQSLGDETARFEAKMLSLAFQVGRMEGQSGNAMSNQDFRKIMEIVSTSGGSAEAFTQNLTDYMAGKIEAYDQKHFKLVGPGSQVATFKDRYKFSPISEPLNMADYVAAQSSNTLKENYARFSGKQAPAPAPAPAPANAQIPSSLADFKTKLQKGNPGLDISKMRLKGLSVEEYYNKTYGGKN